NFYAPVPPQREPHFEGTPRILNSNPFQIRVNPRPRKPEILSRFVESRYVILEQKILTIFEQYRLKQLKLQRLRMQEPALHQTLFILTLGSRIDRYATADTEICNTSFRINHDRADRDVEDTVTTRLQQPDRSCVRTARKTLELVNDLHRANLRRTRDRTTREKRAHQINQRNPVAQC